MEISGMKAGGIAAVAGWFVLMTGCASVAPPQAPSLELPKPVADLRAVRKADKVILTWTVPTATTDRQAVRKVGVTRICRTVGAQLTECGTAVGEAKAGSAAGDRSAQSKSPPVGRAAVAQGEPCRKERDKGGATTSSCAQKVSTTYTDSLPTALLGNDPAGVVTYAVAVANEEGRDAGLSNQVKVSTVRTLAPPQDFAARVTGQGIVLSWTNDLLAASAKESLARGVEYAYRIRRRALGSEESALVASIPAGGAAGLSLTDSNFEWEKTYNYRIEVVTIVRRPKRADLKQGDLKQGDLEIEGEDSGEIKVFADDIFPPAVPAGLQAVFSGPGQQPFIDLVWAPVTDVDLDGYNVYRREEGAAAVKVNAELVRAPAYRDGKVEAGKTYSYSVSAVDVRGNESGRSEEASERVP